MAPRKRGAPAKAKELTQVLPGRLGEKEKRTLAVSIIKQYGGRQSKEAGIDLEQGGDDALERWFLLAVLFSRGVNAGQVVNTYSVLTEGGVKNVSDAGSLEYHQLWDKLTEGKAQRRDRTTKQLQSLNTVLHEKYEGSVRKLLTSTEDPQELRANVEALPYIGPTTAELFLRDLRELYPRVKEVLDISDRALEAGQHLGLFSKAGRGNKRQKADDAAAAAPTKATAALDALAAAADVDCRDLETALIKLHNAHYRGYGKCPGGAECSVVETAGGAEEPAAPKAEGAPGAAAEEEKTGDVSMTEAADVSKEEPANKEAQGDVSKEADGEKEAADVSKEDGGQEADEQADEVAEKHRQNKGVDGKSEEEVATEVTEKTEQIEKATAEKKAAEGKKDRAEADGGMEKQEIDPPGEEKESPTEVPRLEEETGTESKKGKEGPRVMEGGTELKAGA